MTPLRSRMLEELQLRNLSGRTADTYVAAVERFAQHFHQSPLKLGTEQVREYLLHLVRDHQAKPSTVLVNRAALRFLYVCTLKQSWFEEQIPLPKRRPTLPDVLSVEEITRMLDLTENLKHWSILATFYATALRCGELQRLKVEDIDSQRRVLLHVREGKALCANINETNATALMTEQGGEDSSQDEPSASTVAGTRPGGPRSSGPTRTASLYSRVQETHPGLSRCGERKGRYGPIAAPRGTLFVDAGQWASRAGIRSGQSVLTEAWTGAET
jgi:hypothetical protein